MRRLRKAFFRKPASVHRHTMESILLDRCQRAKSPLAASLARFASSLVHPPIECSRARLRVSRQALLRGYFINGVAHETQ